MKTKKPNPNNRTTQNNKRQGTLKYLNDIYNNIHTYIHTINAYETNINRSADKLNLMPQQITVQNKEYTIEPDSRGK